MSLDLSTLQPAATVRIPLDHPFQRSDAGEPVPLDGVAFVLAGPHTAEAREHFLSRADASLDEKDAKPSIRASLADQRDSVLVLLRDIEGLLHEGAPVTPAMLTPEFLRANAALPLLLEQAFHKYAKVGDFFGERKPASSPTPDISASSEAP